MRLKNSLKNAKVSIVMYISSILINFISQSVFIRTLGKEYLGINGLFTNIISILAIVELGFGTAIICNLYKPLIDKDEELIRSLIEYYKKVYRKIALIVLSIGLLIMPFLNIIVGSKSFHENIYFIFLLYLIDTVASYLLTYKRSIFYADQKTYVINIVHIFYLILMNGLQIAILLLYKNFIIYLYIKIIFRILENVVINILANKAYPYLLKKNALPLNEITKNDIVKKVKGLFFHQIGTAVINGTDNIVISMTRSLGIVTVGLYSNYNLIISTVLNLFSQVYSSITSIIGNLLVQENSDIAYVIYKRMLLLNSWIGSFFSISVLCMIEPFITVWIGKSFILSKFVLIVLVANLYLQIMRQTCNTFKTAAGIFFEDRYIPILESTINIVASILFAKYFGLAGVFLGTIVSSFALYFYSYPKYVYGVIFKKDLMQYSKDYLKYFIITFISAALVYIPTEKIRFSSIWIQIIVNGMLCLVIPNVVYYVFLHKTDEYKYWKYLVTKKFKK